MIKIPPHLIAHSLKVMFIAVIVPKFHSPRTKRLRTDLTTTSKFIERTNALFSFLGLMNN